MASSLTLDKLLDIEYPILLAPMFLVSNIEMVKAALDNGITAAIPAMNYRNNKDLKSAILELKEYSDKPFGINLIVNRSNPKFKGQLEVILETKPSYIITSLGNPKEVIQSAHERGILVFCDVVDLKFAKKVEVLGADAIIAVNSKAGGHCGNMLSVELIPILVKNCNIPIISAGNIKSKSNIENVMRLGAAGVSVGTIFIASHESPVCQKYKQALIDYKAKDIVKTTKISGTPLTVINTPYVQKIGTEENFLEWLIHRNSFLKKYAKMLITINGMRSVEKAAFKSTYKTVWCAGPSVESIHSIRSIKEIVGGLI